MTIPFKNPFYYARKRKKKTMNMLESTMNNIDEWMGSNQLKMNASKTQFILFGTNHQLKKTTSIKINVCGENVKKSEIVRYLGVWLDSNLNFKDHSSIKCKSAIWNHQKIWNVCHLVDRKTCELLVCSLVLTHMDYSNGILFGCAENVIQKLQ